MSEGATRSAPARAWLTATRASSSTDASLSTGGLDSRSTPQWPWSVYSQRHTSVITSSSGSAPLERADGRLHDALLVPCPRALGVLVGGHPEQHHAGDPERGRLVGPPRARRRSTGARRRAASRSAHAPMLCLGNEQRQHELAGAELGLAHEPAQTKPLRADGACASGEKPSLSRIPPLNPSAAAPHARARRTAATRAARCTSGDREAGGGLVDGRIERLQGRLEGEHERDRRRSRRTAHRPTDPAGTSARKASGSESRKASSEAARTSRASAPIATPSAPNASAPRASAASHSGTRVQSRRTNAPIPASIAKRDHERAGGGEQRLLGEQPLA